MARWRGLFLIETKELACLWIDEMKFVARGAMLSLVEFPSHSPRHRLRSNPAIGRRCSGSDKQTVPSSKPLNDEADNRGQDLNLIDQGSVKAAVRVLPKHSNIRPCSARAH
jgi:hypothetical protein